MKNAAALLLSSLLALPAGAQTVRVPVLKIPGAAAAAVASPLAPLAASALRPAALNVPPLSSLPALRPAAWPASRPLARLAAPLPDFARMGGTSVREAAETDFMARVGLGFAPSRGLYADAPHASPSKWQSVLDLRPTQFCLGLREVEWRVAKLKSLRPKDQEDYLKDHRVPVVIGPGGALYMIDHHHVVRAAWEVGLKDVPIEVKADLSHLAPADFWKEMAKNGWVYPYDQFGGGPHDPALLPDTVGGLADDPYRSLAWKVRMDGGYQKTPIPFAEFKWADFFRKNLKAKPYHDDFDKASKEALALAKDPRAKNLPGYSGK